MEIVVGTITKVKDKLLMIREAKKECYGKWSFPAGHLEEGETIEEGAIRETLEESGCKVEIKNLLPITYDKSNKVIIIYFLSNLIIQKEIVNKDEILEKKWFSIEQIKNIPKEELRFPKGIMHMIKSIEKDEKYTLNIIKSI